jgi:hypothetical protein
MFSKYLEIFRNPLYLHLAFDRDVRGEVDFMLEHYKKSYGSLPKRILEFESNVAPYSRVFAEKGIECVCYDSRPEFSIFTQDHFNLKNKPLSCINDITSDVLQNVDICLYPLDAIAYVEGEQAAVDLLKFLFSTLNRHGLLIVQSNSGVNLEYIDYSEVFQNKEMQYPIWVKAEWAVNKLEKKENYNHVGKRISVLSKHDNRLLDRWEYSCQEGVHNAGRIKELVEKTGLGDQVEMFFYPNFSFTPWTPLSEETVSVLVKK